MFSCFNFFGLDGILVKELMTGQEETGETGIIYKLNLHHSI